MLACGHGPASRHLEIGTAIAIVDAVAKGGRVVLGHVGVAAQDRVLSIVCGVSGVGPTWIVLICRWFGVLICEEGLVPPINT